jgi:intron-binding protein aquarius
VKKKVQSVVNFQDTFLDLKHLFESFPAVNMQVVQGSRTMSLQKAIEEEKEDKELGPPYVLDFSELEKSSEKEKEKGKGKGKAQVQAQAQVKVECGGFQGIDFSAKKRNKIRFTPKQVEAIRSSADEGLMLVVGPPGTGKTDTAVQIISNWYHNHPDQKMLIVTHSNQALNQLFDKIVNLDVDERHLLRLGHGEDLLETERDFSKFGRVNYILQRRLDLLAVVADLAQSLSIPTDVAYTCETAEYFYKLQIGGKWKDFLLKCDKEKAKDTVEKYFPFTTFFAKKTMRSLFVGSFEKDLQTARNCYAYLEGVFKELQECRAFELMKSPQDRGNYLVTKQARIVAMTCTHAAIKVTYNSLFFFLLMCVPLHVSFLGRERI